MVSRFLSIDTLLGHSNRSHIISAASVLTEAGHELSTPRSLSTKRPSVSLEGCLKASLRIWMLAVFQTFSSEKSERWPSSAASRQCSPAARISATCLSPQKRLIEYLPQEN